MRIFFVLIVSVTMLSFRTSIEFLPVTSLFQKRLQFIFPHEVLYPFRNAVSHPATSRNNFGESKDSPVCEIPNSCDFLKNCIILHSSGALWKGYSPNWDKLRQVFPAQPSRLSCQLRCPNCSDVATRTATNHRHIVLSFCHRVSFKYEILTYFNIIYQKCSERQKA